LQLVFFVSTALLFGGLASYVSPELVSAILWPQFVPSLLSATTALTIASAGFILVIVLTLLFGRVYCSTVCTLAGVLDAGKLIRDARYGMRDTGYWFKKERSEKRNDEPELGGARRSQTAKTTTDHQPPTTNHHLLNSISLYLLLATIIFLFTGNIFLINVFDPFSLGGKIFAVFRGSALIGLPLLAAFLLAGYFSGRSYCNMVCPLGMFLGLFGRMSLYRISSDRKKCKGCGKCEEVCRANCIDHNRHRLDFGNCVGCMDCIAVCPDGAMKYRFRFRRSKAGKAAPPADASRRHFLKTAAGGAASLPLLIVPYHPNGLSTRPDVIPVMPPGSAGFKDFTKHCTACQLCVTNCPSRVLQPSLMEYGLGGIFQPKLDFREGYCLPDCNRCSEICPTDAIRQQTLKEKQKTVIGLAVFSRNLCINAAERKPCKKCYDLCPVKAIKLDPWLGDLMIPRIDETICNGCGACEYICPARPDKAISVESYVKLPQIS
jgi:polyferredoxin